MKEASQKKVVIAGAGPAGLTAAYEIKSPNINVFERKTLSEAYHELPYIRGTI